MESVPYQTNYQVKSRGESEREELFRLWEKEGPLYRTLVPEYKELLEQKRKKIPRRKLWPVSKQVLKDYPDIPLLKITDPEEAIAYIIGIDDIIVIRSIITTIENLKFDCSYRTIYERVKQFRVELRAADKGRSVLGKHPDYPTRMGPSSSYSPYSS